MGGDAPFARLRGARSGAVRPDPARLPRGGTPHACETLYIWCHQHGKSVPHRVAGHTLPDATVGVLLDGLTGIVKVLKPTNCLNKLR